MSERVVISGSGLATALGITREQTWAALLAGRSGMTPLTAMESPLAPGKDGGQAMDLPADYSPDLPREVRYLNWTIRDAMADANLGERVPYDPSRCAVLLGTTLHGIRAGGTFLRTGNFASLRDFSAGATLASIGLTLPFTGAAITVCSACSSSLGSVALAVTLLQNHQADLVIAGGYDTISEYAYGGFNSLRLVADGPLRPFSKNRQGMKLAEGYGIVVLERAADALARKHTPKAQVLGWGESADAHHLTQPHPTGDGAARAIAAASGSASLKPDAIGLIAAHATGTPDNDAGEFAALSRVFGDELPNVPVVAFKSHLGHTLGGAGAVELILSSLALRDQIVPTCANIAEDDIEFASLNVATGKPRPGRIDATLNTSLGFGGANTCVILSRPDPSPLPAVHVAAARQEVCITGVGLLVPGATGVDQLLARMNSTNPAEAIHWENLIGSIAEAALDGLLNARRVRRLSDYVKLQLAAATLAMRHAGFADSASAGDGFSAILGTNQGSVKYSYDYYRQIVKEGISGANPMLFAEGVPNAGAAHLSLMLGVKGACQSVIGSRTAGIDALVLASNRIADGTWQRAIVGAGEEDFDVVRQAYASCGLAAAGEPSAAFAGESGFVTGSGSAAFVLESRASVQARGGRVIGLIDAGAFAHGPASAMANAVASVLKQLGGVEAVLSSADGTWLDRAEAAGLVAGGAKTVSAIYGHVAETFAATPLIGLAVVLASGRLPRLLGSAVLSDRLKPADGLTPISTAAVLASDLTGAVSGVRVRLMND